MWAKNIKGQAVEVGYEQLSLQDVWNVVFGEGEVRLSEKGLERVKESHQFLTDFAKDKVIYGINTGFGPMAQYKIEEDQQKQLQYNLIRSHCSGTGGVLDDLSVRALMLTRLNTLMQGGSGVNEQVVELLAELLNRKAYPKIFCHGGVGASGDLVQLAHLALALIGEGELHVNGQWVDAKEWYAQNGLKPMDIHLREGLAIMNGTAAMTGVGFVALMEAQNLLNWSVLASSMLNELMEAYDDHCSEVLNHAKKHEGQRKVAESMRQLFASSKMVRRRDEHLYTGELAETVFKEKVQEYYSLRCVPQILGPIYDTLMSAEQVLVDEANSINDNPVIDVKTQNVYHGGNFHGDYVALEMDKMKIAVTKMSMLAERQLNFMMNARLNDKLPPFVNLGVLGFNFGMQGVQFTATSTVAENQTLSNPMYVHSIPNNNDNQDVVSMGTNAALMAKKVVENTSEVMAIEFMTLLQAVDFLKVQDQLSEKTKAVYDQLRELVPVFVEDQTKYQDVKKLKDYLVENPVNVL